MAPGMGAFPRPFSQEVAPASPPSISCAPLVPSFCSFAGVVGVGLIPIPSCDLYSRTGRCSGPACLGAFGRSPSSADGCGSAPSARGNLRLCRPLHSTWRDRPVHLRARFRAHGSGSLVCRCPRSAPWRHHLPRPRCSGAASRRGAAGAAFSVREENLAVSLVALSHPCCLGEGKLRALHPLSPSSASGRGGFRSPALRCRACAPKCAGQCVVRVACRMAACLRR